MKLPLRTFFAIAIFFTLTGFAGAEQFSALIGQALDKQLPQAQIDFNGTLPQIIQQFGDMTGVRIEADPAVYDALPWGDLTTFTAHLEHQTLRQALGAICQKLGLQFELQDQSVQLRPLPALRRLGRRCTVDELQALDVLASTSLTPTDATLPAAKLLAVIDQRLEQSAYAIEDRAFAPGDTTRVNRARNASLLDALDEISNQTNATWYPWGKTIVVLKKSDSVRLQLAKRFTTRFTGADVSDVLMELARRSGVDFQIEPAAIQKIPAQFRTIQLNVNDATVQQTLEAVCGFTGLNYDVTDSGVQISSPIPLPPATTQPAH
jgi:hypothetical protein